MVLNLSWELLYSIYDSFNDAVGNSYYIVSNNLWALVWDMVFSQQCVMIVAFWFMISCSFISGHQHVRGTCCPWNVYNSQ